MARTRIHHSPGTEKIDFLRRFKSARNLLVHRVMAPESPGQAAHLERILNGAAIWLTPSIVRRYRRADFPELEPVIGERLESAVEEFREVADKVPPTGPATKSQIDRGRAAFDEIWKILKPYCPDRDDFLKIQQFLGKFPYPSYVITYDFEIGSDSTGDPALWIYLIVEDSMAEDANAMEQFRRLDQELHDAIRDAGIARWPYINFRTATEQKDLLAAKRYVS
ncbi:MAG: hypothetical protein U0800_13575 [Isosphaeraceae bacterium]